MRGWPGDMWPACCHWLNTGMVDGRCPIMFVLTQSLSRLRDFWFGFDGICAFTIVMGIFVLLRVQELVIVVSRNCFCVSILFCHQIKSWFHTWTDSLAVVQCDIFWPGVIINIHLKARYIARNLKYKLFAHGVDASMAAHWQRGGRHLEWW